MYYPQLESRGSKSCLAQEMLPKDEKAGLRVRAKRSSSEISCNSQIRNQGSCWRQGTRTRVLSFDNCTVLCSNNESFGRYPNLVKKAFCTATLYEKLRSRDEEIWGAYRIVTNEDRLLDPFLHVVRLGIRVESLLGEAS